MRKFEHLTASDFPGIVPQEFDEWKKALLNAKRKRNILLVGFILLGVFLSLIAGHQNLPIIIVSGLILIIVVLAFLWRKPDNLAKELGIDWTDIKRVRSKETSKDESRSQVIRFFEKQTNTKTPLLIKIAVIFQILFLLSGLARNLSDASGVWLLTSFLTLSVHVIAIVAIWNLRKWGILLFTIIAVLSFIYAFISTEMSSKIIIAVAVFRGIVILPALYYWKRMT